MSLYDRQLAVTAIIPTTMESWFSTNVELAEQAEEKLFCLVPVAEIYDLAVIVTQPDLTIVDRLSARLKIESPELMTDYIKKITGYSEESQREAQDPEWILEQFIEKTRGCIVASYRSDFDLKLLEIYFEKFKLKPEFHEHRLDLLSYTYGYLEARNQKLPNYNLNQIAKYFNIAIKNPPYMALDRAKLSYDIYCALKNQSKHQIIKGAVGMCQFNIE